MCWNRKNDFPILFYFLIIFAVAWYKYTCMIVVYRNPPNCVSFYIYDRDMYLGNEIWKQQTWFTFFTVFFCELVQLNPYTQKWYSIVKLNISNHSRHIYTRKILVSHLDESRTHHFQFGPTKVQILEFYNGGTPQN